MNILYTQVNNAVMEYPGGGSAFLARGTDGGIGSITSFAWPTPYIAISGILSSTTLPFGGCPSALQVGSGSYLTATCVCGLTIPMQNGEPINTELGITRTRVHLPSNFYYPIDPKRYNYDILMKGFVHAEAKFNLTNLSSWLVEQPWASTLLPKIRQCDFKGTPFGPPGVKIPVAALTATATTTVDGGSLPTHTLPKPAGSQTPPGPIPTTTDYVSLTIGPSSSNSHIVNSAIVPSTVPFIQPLVPQPLSSGASTPGNSFSAARTRGITTSMSFFEPPGPVIHSSATDITGPEPQSPSPAIVLNGGPPSLPLGNGSPVPVVLTSVPVQSGKSSLTGASTVEKGSGLSVSSSATYITPLALPWPISASTKSIDSPSGDTNLPTPTPIATVAGHTINFSPQESHIVVHGLTDWLHLPAIATPIAGSAGASAGEASGHQPGSPGIESASVALGQIVTPNALPFIVADKTLTPDGQAITIAGTPVSLGSSGLVIGTSTLPFSKQTLSPQPVVSILNGDAYTAYPTITTNKAGSISTMLGALATISGTTIYPTALGQKSPSLTSPDAPKIHPTALVTMNGGTYTIHDSIVQIASATISEGAPATTISNTRISLGTNHLMIGSSTILYSPASTPPSAVAITMNGKTYTIQNSAIQFAGVTVSEGAPGISISNTPISLGPSNFVVGSSTILYRMPSATAITINNESLNLENSAVIAPGGITISEGAPAVTVSGTAISLGSTDIVVGASTLEYSQAAGTRSSGDVAAAIMSALGRTEAASSGTATAIATNNITSSGIAPTISEQPFTAGAATSVPVARLVVVLAGMGTWLMTLKVS